MSLVPSSAASQLKSSSGCLRQSGGTQMACAGNVWTTCKTKGRVLGEDVFCLDHLPNPAVAPLLAGRCLSSLQPKHCDSLQIPFTDEVPNGVKVIECITLNLHPPLLSNTVSSSSLAPSGYWSMHSPFHWTHRSRLRHVAPHLASSAGGEQWHLSPAPSACKSERCRQWPERRSE